MLVVPARPGGRRALNTRLLVPCRKDRAMSDVLACPRTPGASHPKSGRPVRAGAVVMGVAIAEPRQAAPEGRQGCPRDDGPRLLGQRDGIVGHERIVSGLTSLPPELAVREAAGDRRVEDVPCATRSSSTSLSRPGVSSVSTSARQGSPRSGIVDYEDVLARAVAGCRRGVAVHPDVDLLTPGGRVVHHDQLSGGPSIRAQSVAAHDQAEQP
jgi:hypothetical protein